MTPKFRAWIKETEEMYEVESVGVRNGELWFVIAGPATPKPYEELTEYQPDEIVLMQSTGVLDDNGAEIYEDDIVIAEGKRGFVMWENGGFQITIYDGLGYHIDEYESLVKIGNTFENPELLEEVEKCTRLEMQDIALKKHYVQ